MQLVRTFLTVLALLVGILTVVYIFWDGLSRIPDTPVQKGLSSSFSGVIAIACDADMLGTAFADGNLNQVSDLEDSLLLLTLEAGKVTRYNRLAASNSAFSNTTVLAFNEQEQLLILSETRKPVPIELQSMKNVWEEFPLGQQLEQFSLAQGSLQDKIIYPGVGPQPQSPTWNHRGDLLAFIREDSLAEIEVWAIDSTKKLRPQARFSFREIWPDAPVGTAITGVYFHPKENILALNITHTHLAFARLTQQEEAWSLDLLADPLEVAVRWDEGLWHPSGRFFYLTDTGWGPMPDGFVLNRKGRLLAVSGPQQPKILSRIKVGLSPQGLAMSPDGRYLVAINMRRTYLPKSLSYIPGRLLSSLSLAEVQEDGQLNLLGKEYGFPGILAKEVVFDATSKSLAVLTFHDQDVANPRKGAIYFWEVTGKGLQRCAHQVDICRGAHAAVRIQ